MGYHFPQASPIPLRTLVPHASAEALSFLELLLYWNPQKRPTASECLQHPYFANHQPILPNQPNQVQENPTSRGNLESRGKGLPSAFRRTNSKWSQGSSRIGGGSSKGKWNIKANVPVVNNKEVVLPKLAEVNELSNFGVAKRNQVPNKYTNEQNYQGGSGQQREDLYLPPVANPASNKMLPSIYDRQPAKDNVFDRQPGYEKPSPYDKPVKESIYDRPNIHNAPSQILDRQPLRDVGLEKNPGFGNKQRDFSIDRQDHDIYGFRGPKDFGDKQTPPERFPSGKGILDKLPKYNPPAFPYMNPPAKKLPPVGGGLSSIGSNIMGPKMQPRGMQKASVLPSIGRHRF